MRYLRTLMKLYLAPVCRFKPGSIIISILMIFGLIWIMHSLLRTVSVSESLEDIMVKAPGDTDDQVQRKTAIYNALKAVRHFLENNPLKKNSTSNHQYSIWLPKIIAKPMRDAYSCQAFDEEGLLQLPVFTVNDTQTILDRTKIPSMAVHLSVDRFQNLDQMLGLWQAPVSAAIYVEHHKIAYLREYLKPAFYKRDDLLLHFVPALGEFYPVNQLRNVALLAAQTDYVFINDVDFMPNPGMHRDLQNIIKFEFFSDGPKAMVIPAFGLNSFLAELPLTKEQLEPEFNKSVSIFSAAHYPQGHSATNYKRWFSKSNIYKVIWEVGWEPYVLVKKTECPLFNQRFIGRIKDKVSFSAALHYLGFSFYVHPTAFITHLHHTSFGSQYRTLYLKCASSLLFRYTMFLEREAKRRKLGA